MPPRTQWICRQRQYVVVALCFASLAAAPATANEVSIVRLENGQICDAHEHVTQTTNCRVTLELEKPSKEPVPFSTHTSPMDGAVDGRDYVGHTQTARQFAPEQTRMQLDIKVLADGVYENKSEEGFRLTVSVPVGEGDSGPAFIVDAQSRPSVSIERRSEPEGDEGARTVVVPVRLSGPSEGPFTITVDARDGSASRGADYGIARSDLVFEPLSTSANIAVKILGDRSVEGGETFYLEAFDDDQELLAQALQTIVDDDLPNAGVVRLAASEYVLREGQGQSILIEAERIGGTDGEVAVDVLFTDGSATRNADYRIAADLQAVRLRWANGEAGRRSVRVDAVDDAIAEGTEVFGLRIEPTVGTTLGSPFAATVMVADDEPKVFRSGFE